MSTPSPALGNRTPEQLKVAELREELKRRGIQIKGLKKDLVDRLEEVLKQEELEQQKSLATIVEDTPGDAEQPEPVTPVTKRRSKAHDHHGHKEDVVVSEPVLASEGTEITVSVGPVAEEPKSQDEDITVPLVTEAAGETAIPVEETTTVAAVNDNNDVGLSVPAGEEVVPVVESTNVVDEQVTTTTAVPALEDLVADLEQNFSTVVQEEPQVGVEETVAIEGEAPSTDILPTVDKAVDDDVAVIEEVISTTFEKTVTTTVEQEVSVVSEDQKTVSVEEEKIVTTSTRVEIMEESANEVATMEETTTTVVTVEMTTTVADDEGRKLAPKEDVKLLEGKSDDMIEEAPKEDVSVLEGKSDDAMEEAPKEDVRVLEGKSDDAMEEALKENVRVLEGKSDDAMEEAPKENVIKVSEEVIVAETPKVDEMVMDVDGKTEKGLDVEEPKEETPMDVDADAQKGSKRKDAAADGELTTLEPTKRRRWNSAKGEEDSKSSGKDVQPLELQEPLPSSNAPVSSAKVSTPKSAPPEKVAVTRTAATRTEAAVNGEGQKTRVVPPSAKPATTSLKIDKFLRPFTFKAVKELLAQTGTVQDVWMDQIKTHCYVTYSSVEEATATRNALFNLQWPPQGGRLLTAEFVDPSEVKLRSDGEKAAAAAGSTAAAAAAPSTNAITPRGGALSANSKAASKDGTTAPSSAQPSTLAAGLLPPPPPLPFSPRDRPKQEVERTPTLDDLFRKTRSKPHIYYLPLTAQEVADKVAARNREAATKPGVKAT